MDIAARENGMSSFRVAKVLFHQLLRGKAKTFAQTALSMPYRYPNANYYCEQLRVQGRKHVRYQPPITNRIPSASSTDGEARTHSSGEDVDSADSISSVATVASIPGDEAAQPQVLHVPHVDRVHRIHRTHHTSRKHRRAEPIPPFTLVEGISAQEWRFLTSQKSKRPLQYKKMNASGITFLRHFSSQKTRKLPTPPFCNPYTRTGQPLSGAGFGTCSGNKPSGTRNFMVPKAMK